MQDKLNLKLAVLLIGLILLSFTGIIITFKITSITGSAVSTLSESGLISNNMLTTIFLFVIFGMILVILAGRRD